VAEVSLSPGASAYQRIISNNSYAHDEQGVNFGQLRGFDSVLYKLWSLLMLSLAALRCQPRWRESQSRQMCYCSFVHPTQHAHTLHTPTNSHPLPGLAHWTNIKVSALKSRVGWTPARNNEWTNESLCGVMFVRMTHLWKTSHNAYFLHDVDKWTCQRLVLTVVWIFLSHVYMLCVSCVEWPQQCKNGHQICCVAFDAVKSTRWHCWKSLY